MRQNKTGSGPASQIVFTFLFFAAITAVHILTFRTLIKSDVPDTKSIWKILAGDAVLGLLTFLLTRKKLHRIRESKYSAAAAACAGPALVLFLVESLLGNLQTMNISAVLMNLAIYYLLFLVFIMILGRPLLASNLLCIVMLIAALCEYFVMKFRGQPITLFDLQSIGTAFTVAGGYTFDLPVSVGLLLQVCLGYLLLLHFLKKIRIPRDLKWCLLRLGGTGLSILCFFLLIQITGKGTFDFWKINENYQKKGFVYTLLWEVKYVKPEKPSGYSTQKIKSTVKKAEQNYSNRVQEAVTQPQNIIVIMNESLADFSHIGEIKADKEIMPFLSSLKKNTVKGYVQVPVIGGGTAETEYEFLTGNSKQFLPTGSTAYMVYCNNPEYGITRTLKTQGYTTIALHPYYAQNWNRSKVYPELGFDEFYSIENWGSDTELIRSYTSDASAYDKVISLTEQTEDRLFTFLVTLQNHGGYAEESLDGYEPTVSLDYEQNYPHAETYFSLLNESDQAFKKLVDYFKDSEEPTMIVMFGDHFPGVEEDFYTELLGKPVSELNDEEQQKIYQTPYIIWTNYDLGANIDGETISANYLSTYVLELAGLEMPSYNKFLLELKDNIPIIGKGMICDSFGNWYSLTSLPAEYEEPVNQYRYLQYYRISDRGSLTADIYGLSGS